MKILLVEDDPLLTQVLVEHLSNQHYTVDVAIDGAVGFDYARATSYDLIVLDINLPKLNGIELCELLRRSRQTMPILLLTAQADSAAKVIGLDAGADDYVVKPCAVEEISARIRALLRRPSLDKSPILRWGSLQLDPVTLEVSCSGRAIALSSKEYSLLALLLRHPQRIFSSGSILEHLWSFAAAPSEETVRSHVKRLRRKLKSAGSDDPIETVHGIGYRLKSAPPASTPADQARAAALARWEQFKPAVFERIACLDRAVAALESGCLSIELRQTAAEAAHKLAGSLALFGFPAATQLGRDLEQLLRSNQSLSLDAIRVRVNELHCVLSSTPAIAFPMSRLQLVMKRILVIDDEADIREIARMSLQITQQWEVLTAASGQAGIAIAAAVQPDAILLDVLMPDLDGLATLQALGQHPETQNIPVLLLTAALQSAAQQSYLALGAKAVLLKPFDPGSLGNQIAAILNWEQPQ